MDFNKRSLVSCNVLLKHFSWQYHASIFQRIEFSALGKRNGNCQTWRQRSCMVWKEHHLSKHGFTRTSTFSKTSDQVLKNEKNQKKNRKNIIKAEWIFDKIPFKIFTLFWNSLITILIQSKKHYSGMIFTAFLLCEKLYSFQWFYWNHDDNN